MTRVIAYIDGFNLYHAIHDLGAPHLKWVNLWALTKSLLKDDEKLNSVYYFSAYANWIPEAAARHRQYVKALKHAGVVCVMGHFKDSKRRCKNCKAEWIQHEEKETDVNIAVHLVADAFQDNFDKAILITADSDLAPAIKIVKTHIPQKNIFVASPPGRFGHARVLKPRFEITKGRIKKCLLPAYVEKENGEYLFERPLEYEPPS